MACAVHFRVSASTFDARMSGDDADIIDEKKYGGGDESIGLPRSRGTHWPTCAPLDTGRRASLPYFKGIRRGLAKLGARHGRAADIYTYAHMEWPTLPARKILRQDDAKRLHDDAQRC